MINYIQAEIFRAKNSRLIKFIILAGIIMPALLLALVYQESDIKILNLYNNRLQNHYIYIFTTLTMPAAFFVGQLLLIYVKKNDHIYRLILSQGISKNQLVLYDLVSYNVLTIIISILALIISIFYGNLLGYIYYDSFLSGNEIFFIHFIQVLLIQLISNMISFSLYMILKSIPLTIAVNFLLVSISSSNFVLTLNGDKFTNRFLFLKLIRFFSPYNLFETYFGDDRLLLSGLEPLDAVKILAYSLVITTISITISQAAFRRREL